MLPVAKITSLRLCGAMIFHSYVPNVMVNLMPICTIGSFDTHGGVAVTGSTTVFADCLPICREGDVNDCCKWIYPPHATQPLVECDLNVYSM